MGKIWQSSLSQAFVYNASWAFFGSDNGTQPLVCHLTLAVFSQICPKIQNYKFWISPQIKSERGT